MPAYHLAVDTLKLEGSLDKEGVLLQGERERERERERESQQVKVYIVISI